MLDSRTEEILKSILGDEANPEPPLSRVEALLYRLGEKIGSVTTFKIKGRVDSVSDLPADAQPGDFYFVGLEGSDDFDEYVMKDDHTWEHIGTTQADMSAYLLKDDAVGKKMTNGGEIFNNATSAGRYAHAEGWGTIASGMYAHAEGFETTASGDDSHSEGNSTTASGMYAHAEGVITTASGWLSHSEGYGTTASGNYSHAEGNNTISASEDQHVEGRYNVEDTEGKFAHIIGNGTYDTRSNALAIDWEGKIYVDNAATGIDVSKLIIPTTEEEFIAMAEAGTLIPGSLYVAPEEE